MWAEAVEPPKRQWKQQQELGRQLIEYWFGAKERRKSFKEGWLTVPEDTHMFLWLSEGGWVTLLKIVCKVEMWRRRGTEADDHGLWKQLEQDGGSECRQLSLQCWWEGKVRTRRTQTQHAHEVSVLFCLKMGDTGWYLNADVKEPEVMENMRNENKRGKLLRKRMECL